MDNRYARVGRVFKVAAQGPTRVVLLQMAVVKRIDATQQLVNLVRRRARLQLAALAGFALLLGHTPKSQGCFLSALHSCAEDTCSPRSAPWGSV
eukprot:366243-Chlamydomonas_euryale.AAC.10